LVQLVPLVPLDLCHPLHRLDRFHQLDPCFQ
jgi:hypothetical protein